MCCLFGVVNYSGKPNNEVNELVNCLAQHATVRGMDSTGIAYNKDGVLKIYKKPLSAYQMCFKGVEDSACIIGHTRHATQGSEQKNYNNHPFMGYCENTKFALAHNGVLWNDKTLRSRYGIAPNRIETDSYIAVQLLEKYGTFNFQNIGEMAETVNGSFAFSMVDESDNLWLVKGDNPLSIVHLPKQKMYVYASTNSILFNALNETEFLADIIAKDFDVVKIDGGEIVRISADGKITRGEFEYYDKFTTYYDWRTWGTQNKNNSFSFSTPTPTTAPITVTPTATPTVKLSPADEEYLKTLRCVARTMGIYDEEIDELLEEGFTLEEIEDYVYYEDSYVQTYAM